MDLLVLSFKFVLQSRKLPFAEKLIPSSKYNCWQYQFYHHLFERDISIFVKGWFPTFLLKDHNFSFLGINGEQPIVTIFARMESAFCRPLAECETNTKSSTYSKQFNFEPLGNVMESVSSRSSKKGISFKYKLNNMGERMQPCRTPFW